MVESRTPMVVADAINRVMELQVSGRIETIPLAESYGRFLGEDIFAKNDVPHFDRAAYDGFAVRASDTEKAGLNHPVVFTVVDHIGAGHVSSKQVRPFEAVRIMTGAQLPADCDTVIMLEMVKEFERENQPFFKITKAFAKGENIFFRGEDIREGEKIIPRGTQINPGVQAVLATFGYAKVPVAEKPFIGLFATGTELLRVEDPLEPGKIRDSNGQMVAGQIERAGGKVLNFGSLPDDFAYCLQAVEEALSQVDLLITTGGVSVGDFDFLPAIYRELGAEVLFNKIAMRPGSVTTVAYRDGKAMFGLSGNPSACYVGFELFARPVIRKTLFSQHPSLRKERAVLQTDFATMNPFTRFARGTAFIRGGRLFVEASGKDKTNIVTSLVRANALIILPGGVSGFHAGTEVDILLLDD
ncbi:molybdopterin molybdotransferase MoeA [Bacillaceae bacterium Marseille-Q3522]|nr:molybdopterin molybdotransferase MoeA [Bacillaceae bacterium Marseille-Q3522]